LCIYNYSQLRRIKLKWIWIFSIRFPMWILWIRKNVKEKRKLMKGWSCLFFFKVSELNINEVGINIFTNNIKFSYTKMSLKLAQTKSFQIILLSSDNTRVKQKSIIIIKIHILYKQKYILTVTLCLILKFKSNSLLDKFDINLSKTKRPHKPKWPF
jgi:hypothetical protein